MEEIFTRRSIRKFTNQPVGPEKIDKLVKAAMQAPSAANQQAWEFIVVQDKKGRMSYQKHLLMQSLLQAQQ